MKSSQERCLGPRLTSKPFSLALQEKRHCLKCLKRSPLFLSLKTERRGYRVSPPVERWNIQILGNFTERESLCKSPRTLFVFVRLDCVSARSKKRWGRGKNLALSSPLRFLRFLRLVEYLSQTTVAGGRGEAKGDQFPPPSFANRQTARFICNFYFCR